MNAGRVVSFQGSGQVDRLPCLSDIMLRPYYAIYAHCSHVRAESPLLVCHRRDVDITKAYMNPLASIWVAKVQIPPGTKQVQ